MHRVPDWQEIAKSYYVAVNRESDTINFARGKNAYTELRYVHAQQVGVQAYYRKLLSRALRETAGGHVGAHQMDEIRRMAEAQFGQMLLGVK